MVRYTLAAGTAAAAPTATSPAFAVGAAPIELSVAGKCSPCSVAARVFDKAGVGLDPITRATFTGHPGVAGP